MRAFSRGLRPTALGAGSDGPILPGPAPLPAVDVRSFNGRALARRLRLGPAFRGRGRAGGRPVGRAQLESYLRRRTARRIETQLADAIDLMVAACAPGRASPMPWKTAIRESRRPLRPQLEDVVGRFVSRDDPRTVYHGLTEHVPLETFLLFASALSVQSETGGSLAPTLASVGRTIRDRIEIARRIRSNSAQSEVSTVAVILADVLHCVGGVGHESRSDAGSFWPRRSANGRSRARSCCKRSAWCGCR